MIKYFYIFVVIMVLDHLKLSNSVKVHLPKVQRPDFDIPMPISKDNITVPVSDIMGEISMEKPSMQLDHAKIDKPKLTKKGTGYESESFKEIDMEDENYEVHANTMIVNKKPLILGERKRDRNMKRIKSGKTAKIKIEEIGNNFTDLKGSIDQSLDDQIDSSGQKRLDSFANDQRVMSGISVDMKSIAKDVSNQSANSFDNNNNLVIRDSVKQKDYKSNGFFTTEMTPIPDTNLDLVNPRQSKNSDQFGNSKEGGVKAGHHFSEQNFNSFDSQLSQKNKELSQQSIKSSFDKNISIDSNVSQHMNPLKGKIFKQIDYKDKSEMRQSEVKQINVQDLKQQEIQNAENMKEFSHLNKSESIKNLKSFSLSDGQLDNQIQTVNSNGSGSGSGGNQSIYLIQLKSKQGNFSKNKSSSQTHIEHDDLFSGQLKIRINHEQKQSGSEIHKDQASSEKKISSEQGSLRINETQSELVLENSSKKSTKIKKLKKKRKNKKVRKAFYGSEEIEQGQNYGQSYGQNYSQNNAQTDNQTKGNFQQKSSESVEQKLENSSSKVNENNYKRIYESEKIEHGQSYGQSYGQNYGQNYSQNYTQTDSQTNDKFYQKSESIEQKLENNSSKVNNESVESYLKQQNQIQNKSIVDRIKDFFFTTKEVLKDNNQSSLTFQMGQTSDKIKSMTSTTEVNLFVQLLVSTERQTQNISMSVTPIPTPIPVPKGLEITISENNSLFNSSRPSESNTKTAKESGEQLTKNVSQVIHQILPTDDKNSNKSFGNGLTPQEDSQHNRELSNRDSNNNEKRMTNSDQNRDNNTFVTIKSQNQINSQKKEKSYEYVSEVKTNISSDFDSQISLQLSLNRPNQLSNESKHEKYLLKTENSTAGKLRKDQISIHQLEQTNNETKQFNKTSNLNSESEDRMINANKWSASSNRTDNRNDSSNTINNIKIIDTNKKNIFISLNNSTNDSLHNNSIKEQLIPKSEDSINNTKIVPVFESTVVQRQGQSVTIANNYNFSEEIKNISKYFKIKSQDLYQMSDKLKMTDKINELLKRAETEAFIDSNDYNNTETNYTLGKKIRQNLGSIFNSSDAERDLKVLRSSTSDIQDNRADDHLANQLIHDLYSVNGKTNSILTPTSMPLTLEGTDKKFDIKANNTEINSSVNKVTTNINKKEELEDVLYKSVTTTVKPWMSSPLKETIETAKLNNEFEANKQVMKENSSENRRTQNNYDLFRAIHPNDRQNPTKGLNPNEAHILSTTHDRSQMNKYNQKDYNHMISETRNSMSESVPKYSDQTSNDFNYYKQRTTDQTYPSNSWPNSRTPYYDINQIHYNKLPKDEVYNTAPTANPFDNYPIDSNDQQLRYSSQMSAERKSTQSLEQLKAMQNKEYFSYDRSRQNQVPKDFHLADDYTKNWDLDKNYYERQRASYDKLRESVKPGLSIPPYGPPHQHQSEPSYVKNQDQWTVSPFEDKRIYRQTSTSSITSDDSRLLKDVNLNKGYNDEKQNLPWSKPVIKNWEINTIKQSSDSTNVKNNIFERLIENATNISTDKQSIEKISVNEKSNNWKTIQVLSGNPIIDNKVKNFIFGKPTKISEHHIKDMDDLYKVQSDQSHACQTQSSNILDQLNLKSLANRLAQMGHNLDSKDSKTSESQKQITRVRVYDFKVYDIDFKDGTHLQI